LHRKILTFDEFCQTFQPKLQFLAFSITGKHLSRTILPLLEEYWGFRFFNKDQSNFSISTTTANPSATLVQTSIYPVPKAKLPVSDFVLLVPSCLTYA
jgi:hypothetical protein